MKKFIDLNSEESKGLDIILYRNAIKLKDDAKTIALENKSFSTATSLLILSSEEIIKASLVLLHSKGFRVYELPEAKKFFYDHKIRHQIAQLLEMGVGIGEAIQKWDNRVPTKIFKSKYNFFNNVFDIVSSVKPSLESLTRIDKLTEFNNIKNNGLYVDYRDKILNPKEVVLENEYMVVLEIAFRLFDFYDGLNQLFDAKTRTADEKEKIEKAKKDLKLFIDKVAINFLFKDIGK